MDQTAHQPFFIIIFDHSREPFPLLSISIWSVRWYQRPKSHDVEADREQQARYGENLTSRTVDSLTTRMSDIRSCSGAK